MRFSDRLRLLRLQHGYTQEDVGRVLGVGYNTIGNYERGMREPTIEGIKRLAQHFGVSADYMMGRTDDPSPHQPAADDGGSAEEPRLLARNMFTADEMRQVSRLSPADRKLLKGMIELLYKNADAGEQA